jgi:methionyl aminopeptidase
VIELKTPAEVDAIAAAGKIVASILLAVRDHAAPGVTPLDLDALAADLIADAGGTPTFLGYRPRPSVRPYPAVLCTSVNDAVVHAIPDSTPLAAGDLLSVDLAVHLDGWCADSALSFVVGAPRTPADQALIAATEQALHAGIAAAHPGATLGDIGAAIAKVARSARYGMLADHGGHGIGRAMHEDPHVPNESRPHTGLRLRPGLVLAIEPMLIAGGTDAYTCDPDGWTLRTADRSRAAHAEHTIAVTENGPRILTPR